MSGILADLEDALVEFVKNRVPQGEWEQITNSASVLNRLDDDSEEELKEHFWNELIGSVRWSSVVAGVLELIERQNPLPEEEEEEEEEDDASSTSSGVSAFSSR
jgi:hypothetical protein